MSTITQPESVACQMLSTGMHKHCGGCGCPCHEKGSYGGSTGRPRRPHSFPRPDWEMGRRPKSWKEDKAAKQREERLLGLV